MKAHLTFIVGGLFVLMVVLWGVGQRPWPIQAAPTTVQAPVLKWQHGGCYNSWCETGWYSSPAVADLDGNGSQEVIASAYSIVALNGADGSLLWRVKSGHDRSEGDNPSNVGRTWPGIVVADVDGNGDLEIVTAHGGGWVAVYDHQGYFATDWPKQPTDRELRGLSVYDLDDNGDLEIAVTGAVSSQTNTWVYEHTGELRAGWPQLSNDSGYAYGVFNDNAALGDLDGDGQGEIVVPSDVHYINAYEANGAQIAAHAMYGGKGWGRVGIWENLAVELRGWGECNGVRAESYRTNFAHGPAVIADVNRDGQNEVIATGNVYDCNVGHPPGKYNGVYIFNADRSRFNSDGFNWESAPTDTGAPLTEAYEVIENNQPNPAVADLDGDGRLEILYASYDGRVHAFWLDKTEHGDWPYSVYNAAEGFYRFASEPAIADLDNDGQAEVIFTSWTAVSTTQTGKLHILSSLGAVLHEVPLPTAFGSLEWNGALPAPTLANIDADADLEVVVNTAHSGVVAYDLPGTAGARILWGTGRGNYQRTGSLLYGSLTDSYVSATPLLPGPGDQLTYTIHLDNPGPTLPSAAMTNTLPAQVTYFGNLSATAGSASYDEGVVTWQGPVAAGETVVVQFSVTVGAGIVAPTPIVNTVYINDGVSQVFTRSALVIANGTAVYLPVVVR